MHSSEHKKQLNEIFEELVVFLDITKTEYEAIARSYTAVGEWLAKEDSSLRLYAPEIMPQGSFRLGTMIRPVCEEDDIDIDLVCQLTKKPDNWTQFDLKQKVGDRIKKTPLTNKCLIQKAGVVGL